MATPTLPLLTTALTTQGLPCPHPLFLTPILSPSSSQRLPPLPALTATAKHRLLTSDFTAPNILSSSTSPLPPNLSSATIVSRTLDHDTYVQVLDIEDLGRSKWEQVEALEMERKGEMTKGREVIRVVNATPDNDLGSSASTQSIKPTSNSSTTSSHGPFKLLLQDVKGQQVYGFELSRVEKINFPPTMNIGSKVMLRKGCKVARGMVLLEPKTVVVLGGKIEVQDKAWREGREERLRDAVKDNKEREGE